VFLDVLYALIVFRMLAYLPSAEDMAWVGKPLGLLGRLIHERRELRRPVMGIGLTVICWTLNNKRLNQLKLTDGLHTLINLVQMAFVCLFLYFAIADPMLAGGTSSRALQCASLALAGSPGSGHGLTRGGRASWMRGCRSSSSTRLVAGVGPKRPRRS